jgi:hypothetical protein
MPRTSYGDEKREQSWKIIASLLQSKVGTEVEPLPGIVITYQDWSSPSPMMRVNGTLSSLSRLCGDGLSIDQVRESLNEHLGNKFLGILKDERERKAGRGAEQWRFSIHLWSSDLGENEVKFEELWNRRRSEREKRTNRFYDVADIKNSQSASLVVDNLESVLSPYEGLIHDFITSTSHEFSKSEVNKLSENSFRDRLLSVVQKVSNAHAVAVLSFHEQDNSWFSENVIGEPAEEYVGVLCHEILAVTTQAVVQAR